MTVEDSFAALPVPPSDTSAMSATLVPSSRVHRIAKDALGRPCFVVTSRAYGAPPAPVELQNLSFRPLVRCEIRDIDGRTVDGIFTLITYTGTQPPVRSLFLRVLGELLETLGDECSTSELSYRFEGLVSLFAALVRPQRKTIQGLWAEMLLISVASDPSALVNAWHSEPTDRYDFNSGSQRIEVKSALGSVRRHHFGLVQLTPPPGTRAIVASVLVQRSGGGTSIQDLWRRIRDQVRSSRESALRVDHVVAESLGDGVVAALDTSYDEESATDSISFISIHDVPRVPGPLSPAISDVHFSVDLSGLPLALVPPVASGGTLFSAAKPAFR